MCVNYWNDSSKLRMQVITIKNDIIDAISYTHIAIEAQICVEKKIKKYFVSFFVLLIFRIVA